MLDHRVTEQTSTRRLRILKYRGSLHGTNEYPFLIGESGVSVLPITSLGLRHGVSTERISTGVARLDAMLGDGGFYKGSTVLVSGTAGTGKSTLAAQFCDADLRARRARLYFAFEESEAEIVRNMSSVGIDLRQWVDAGLLQFRCFRPSLLGLEAHLFAMQKLRRRVRSRRGRHGPGLRPPRASGPARTSSAMLTRQIDFLKARGVTALFTSLNADAEPAQADQQIASLVDTWLLRQDAWRATASTTACSTCSSRAGMAHSNQIREFLLTGQGIELADVYVGPQGVLTGSARQAQEAKERSDGHRPARGSRAASGQPRTPPRGGRGADRGAVARVRGRGRQRAAPARAMARPASRTGPGSAPSRAGCARPTPTRTEHVLSARDGGGGAS